MGSIIIHYWPPQLADAALEFPIISGCGIPQAGIPQPVEGWVKALEG